MSAVILLQEMMLRKKLDPASAQDDDEEEIPLPNQNNKDKVAVLAIAYHNMGVEQEFLRSYPAAILSYKKAVNFAEKNLGPEDGITMNLMSVYENAKNEVSKTVTFIHLICSWTWPYSKRAKEPQKQQVVKYLRKRNRDITICSLTNSSRCSMSSMTA